MPTKKEIVRMIKKQSEQKNLFGIAVTGKKEGFAMVQKTPSESTESDYACYNSETELFELQIEVDFFTFRTRAEVMEKIAQL